MDKYVGHTYWENYCEILTSRGCPGGCSFCYEWSMYDPRFPKDFISWRCRSAKIKERFDFADQVDPDIFALHFVTPMPGSPVWKKKVRQRQIEPKDLDLRRWDLQHPVMPTKHLSVEELGRLGAWCSREFYSRPERIHRIMEGNYSPLVKLCIKDFMSNVSNFERAAAAGEIYV